MLSPELLMPGGSFEKVKFALEYGADAVYVGPPFFSLRARENPFDLETLALTIDYAHQLKKKVYVTLNIFSRNQKLNSFREVIGDIAQLKPDAFIMSDPGLMSIVREKYPEFPIHLSVQANCMNWESARFWSQALQIERLILSRELSLNEISEIKNKLPHIELEAFVHGSICIAYSGRCLLSSYMDRRDANQGVCDNSCREKYQLHSREFAIEDDRGEFFPVEEDGEGTYIMNSRDLCMIDYLKEIIDSGVCSLKVEGRTKSEFYVAQVARAYRGALNDLQAHLPVNPQWRKELEQMSHRGFHTGFMLGEPGARGQNYDTSQVYAQQRKVLGFVGQSELGSVKLNVKNRLNRLDRIQVIRPGEVAPLGIQVKGLRSHRGEELSVAHSGMNDVQLFFDELVEIPQNSILMGGQDGLAQ